jgi:2-polyprenyl-3-methyl-5-hydroxy-6-metoxy-1,4-benzoquinol methylase
LHLHLHASLSNKKNKQQKTAEFSVTKMKQLLSSLESAVASLNFSEKRTIWSEYYEEAAQRDAYLNNKKTIIDTWIKKLSILSALDVGSNEGEFSELLAARNIYAISIDGDHHAINKLYNRIKRGKIKNIQPLVIDITNPSPSIGWNNKERASFLDRTNTDLVLALAVIHHLVIGKNIPLEKISSLFSMLGNKLIIEFVPKDDEKVQLMLQHRKDVFEDYTEENFLKIFSGRYKVLDQQNISTSKRTLYLMERI